MVIVGPSIAPGPGRPGGIVDRLACFRIAERDVGGARCLHAIDVGDIRCQALMLRTAPGKLLTRVQRAYIVG